MPNSWYYGGAFAVYTVDNRAERIGREIIYKCPDAPTNRVVSNKYQRASKRYLAIIFLSIITSRWFIIFYIVDRAPAVVARWRWRAWAKSWKTRQRDGASDVAERENDAGGRVSREFRSVDTHFLSLSRPANGVNRWPAENNFKRIFHEIIKKGKSNDALNLSISDLYRLLLQHEMVARAFTQKSVWMKNRSAYNKEPPNFKRISSPYSSIGDDVLGFFTGKKNENKKVSKHLFIWYIPPVLLLLAKIEIHWLAFSFLYSK